jgi:hypothetical protein
MCLRMGLCQLHVINPLLRHRDCILPLDFLHSSLLVCWKGRCAHAYSLLFPLAMIFLIPSSTSPVEPLLFSRCTDTVQLQKSIV